MQQNTINVLLVDDSDTVRSTLKMVLERDEVFRVVAQSACIQQGVELYQTHKPDIVLTDVSMKSRKSGDGLDMCQKIFELDPFARIIVLSGLIIEDAMLIAALKTGISGYLTKNISIDELTKYLLDSMTGKRVFTPYIQRKLSYLSTE